ncbi:TerB family tellurite resistance protein [Spongiibacter nanhainus]|uniref:TerB family tellurite resistance protein n=1 Tax=Spongiibacter nanhainus TaxID=2794344 RepID=A0A7T4R341_9GAMM|nr:TerB family tellurite resistance protein [Spongiibacter nanhainus]QQD19599.1 TerB family tellurite resistance protein [Spongiibacter nanhainus]
MFELLRKMLGNDTPDEAETMTLEKAAGALLIEVSKSDYDQDPAEVEKIRDLLSRHFSVSVDDMEGFMKDVEDHSHQGTSLYPYTRFINDNCSNEEKYLLIKSLWEVAAEDGRIDKYEDYVIRKVSDLIYLPHSDFIRAKLEVTKAAGL